MARDHQSIVDGGFTDESRVFDEGLDVDRCKGERSVVDDGCSHVLG